MSSLVSWVVTPCGIVGRYQLFGETYCLHLQGGRMFLRNADIYVQVHTTLQPKRQTSTKEQVDHMLLKRFLTNISTLRPSSV
jgi:hypothetical protein